MRADEFAALLNAKRLRRGHWVARCPAHPDKHPSLSIAEGRKHPVVFRCMSAGCTQDEVLRAMGLTWKDLMGERPAMNREASERLQNEQTLHALRDLKRALISPAGAFLAGSKAKLDKARACLAERIIVIENKLDPRMKVIRERERKTALFVERWGWTRLWEIYLERNPL